MGSENVERTFLLRSARAKNVSKIVNLSSGKSTLHFGILDLPFADPPRGQRHYIYCDATWDSWAKHSRTLRQTSLRVQRIAEYLEKKAFEQAQGIFTTSNYVKESLINHYLIPAEKVTVVGTGLGVIQPFYGRKEYQNAKILFAAKGRFNDKGGDLVLEAFEILRQRRQNIELTIVGQNNYTKKVQRPNVTSYGYLPVEKLQEIFNTHSLFVMPAPNEAWGLVYLEAMSCRMPIIGLNRNAFPEISGYGQYGFGLDEENPELLADIIIKAFDNPDVLNTMGQKGQVNSLNKYSWNKVVDKILKVVDTYE
jgi:glycosyltransferase involved in cell wall biosynthesis